MKKLLCVVLLSSCATRYEVKEVKTQLEVKDSIDGKKIGLNSKKEVVVQSETNASDELRSQQWANSRLQDELKYQYDDLKQCREDLADPRLGGTGELNDLPEVASLQLVEAKEEFGMTGEGSLKIVKKEYFLDRLEAERKLALTLQKEIKSVTKFNDACKRKMSAARLKVGLPGKRYEAKGYFMEDGTWVQTKRAEMDVNDAYELSALKQKGE